MKYAQLVVPLIILLSFPGMALSQTTLKPGVEIGAGALYAFFPSILFAQASLDFVPAVSRWGLAIKISYGVHDNDNIVVGSVDVVYNLTREGPTRPYLLFGPVTVILNGNEAVWVDAGAGIRTRLTKSNSVGMYVEVRVVPPWFFVTGLSGGITIRF